MMITFTVPEENERSVTGMAKYIDRDALIEWLKRIPIIDLSDGRGLCRVIMEDDFKKAIKKMPKGIIADVEPVRHGRWLPQIVLGTRVWGCSECKTIGSPQWKRCPVCEAKMDEEVK